MNILIRAFKDEDFKDVQKIYAEGIATGMATFETEAPTFKLWNDKFIETCQLVAELDGNIVGFAVLSQVSKRQVYKGVAEVTIYITENEREKGIGNKLLQVLVEKSEKEGFWTLQAGIFSVNKPSIELHKKCGFRVVGIREKIGKRDGKWHDNHLLERRSNKIN